MIGHGRSAGSRRTRAVGSERTGSYHTASRIFKNNSKHLCRCPDTGPQKKGPASAKAGPFVIRVSSPISWSAIGGEEFVLAVVHLGVHNTPCSTDRMGQAQACRR